jgi:imidazolonepropionase-like amidohydrolase
MNKVFILLLSLSAFAAAHAQRIVPAPAQQNPVAIIGGTVHVGNGQVIENGTVVFSNGKIVYAGSAAAAPSLQNMQSIKAEGKQIYPGIIAPNTQLGLNEIEMVRATNDYAETGNYNPGVRSLIAYNTDSRVIPTVRSNGILLAQTTPTGGVISGSSSVMQLDAWNWEDGQYKADDGIHLNWPGFFSFQFSDNVASVSVSDQYEKQVTEIRQYFAQAKSYSESPAPVERNINFEAMRGLFSGTRNLYVHCNFVREIMNAVQFAGDLNLRLVIVGGSEAYKCSDLLKEKNVPVILSDVHSLPGSDDDDVNTPYETAGMLNKAGVKYCLSTSGYWQIRNLPFMAGTSVAYGVTKEDALKSITGSTAEILGISDRTGTLESGKDANLIVCGGDVMDMKTSNIEMAFIQGRQINLDDAQKQLNEIYLKKYGLK